MRSPGIALYASRRGNYFFFEIRSLLAAALNELGYSVELRDERRGFSKSAAAHVVIAPHEFFYLGAGAALREKPFPRRLALYGTEQPRTQWRELAMKLAYKADALWDLNAALAREAGAKGRFVPLGGARRCSLFDPVLHLPGAGKAPCRRWELVHRPIDIFFAGNGTVRRREFFSKYARVLSRFRLCLRWTDPAAPLAAQEHARLSRLTIGLVQRAKIVLNIHRAEEPYFEWQRVVVHGIAQGALVLSEPVADCAPLLPGRDFIACPLERMAEAAAEFLSTPAGLVRAQSIAASGRSSLAGPARMSLRVKDAIEGLLSGESLKAVRRERVARELLSSGRSS